MRSVDLGQCCTDCFNALNFSLDQLEPDAKERAQKAGVKLSLLADKEEVKSLHTGKDEGFSWGPCAGCNNLLGGDRWQLVGLEESRKDNS